MLAKFTQPYSYWPSWLINLILVIFGSVGVALLTSLDAHPLVLLAVALGPAIGLIILFNPEWGLLLLVFMVYTRFSDALIGSLNAPSMAKPFIAFLVLVVVARWFLFREALTGWKYPLIFLGAYGLMGLLAMLHAASPEAVRSAMSDFAKDAVIMLIVTGLLKNTQSLRRVVWALLFSGIFLGSITTYQQITGTFTNTYWGFAQATLSHIIGEVNDYRIGGPGLGPNGYGQFMLFLVPLALDRLWNEPRRHFRVFAGWALTVSLLTVFFTFSRGVFLGLLVVLALMFIRRPPKPLALLVTLALAVVLLQFLPARYMDRMSTLVDFLPGSGQDVRSEVSFRGRLSENLAGIQMFLDHPILGVGPLNYKHHYQSYARELGLERRREERSAHNLYLELASELGLVGLIWFGLLQWVTFKGLREAQLNFRQAKMPSYESLAIAFAVAMVSFLITSIFRHMAYPRYVWLIYGIVLAIPDVSRQVLKNLPANHGGSTGESTD
ncbi:MAG: hypothetical protein FOGNACKC_01128 [Anaerolineae bacterium]|nr:hypothetical protein [Anaerolineae bacterium]